tara:strand:+ start:307 stop:498 length:192 start_codon:yes stop_codon:yes gene_type:complete
MNNSSVASYCAPCGKTVQTNLYHDSNLEKIKLCKQCYDQYLANEMVQYWKDHIDEEARRVGKK